MSRLHLTMLLAIGAIWGATPLMNKIALRGLSPATLTAGRIALAVVVITTVLCLSGDGRAIMGALRAAPGRLAVAAILNAVAPFLLIAWGQQWITTGLAGILVSSAPLFTVLMAIPLDSRERVTGVRLAGFLVGFAGVVVLLASPREGGELVLAGSLAMLAAAFFYAVGALYVGRTLGGLQATHAAAGTLAWAMLLTLPAGLAQFPEQAPGWGPVAAVVALGVANGGAYILFFRLIAGAGASRAIVVSYLVPALAVLYGATFLSEQVGPATVGGLALVLAGVALSTGLIASRGPAAPPVI